MVIVDLKSAELPKLFKKEGFHQAFTTYSLAGAWYISGPSWNIIPWVGAVKCRPRYS